MVNFVSHISVAEAATIINAIIATIQQTIELALVVVLIYTLHNVNSALSWSVITRSIHSSLWPTLLHADSSSSMNSNFRVSFISVVGFASTVLIIIASVITPLGLRNGPIIPSASRTMDAAYMPDTSPIGLATSPRDHFTYGRICGAFSPVPCPGNGNNGNTSAIAPSIMKIFTSTNHSVFNMQFRTYYQGTGGYNYSMSRSQLNMLQSFVLRDDIFAVEGVVADFTMNPGIGLWNHTMPMVERGGVWSHEMLWLEPVTSCVNTNLTIDYKLTNNAITTSIDNYNLTDRGGLVNLTTEYPTFSRDRQHTDIHTHAYKAAVLSNFDVLRSFNITRNQSYVGRTFPLNFTQTNVIAGTLQHISLGAMGQADNLNASVANSTGAITASDLGTVCEGYGGQDTANITNIGVHCGMLLGPPERTDGGDPRLPADNSTWSQNLHACASVTQARLQNVQFSFNGTSGLSNLQISRQNTNTPVLWAVENTTLHITDVDIFWGHISDSFKDDPSIVTTNSEVLYLPAGASDTWGVVSAGQPSTIPSASWYTIYEPGTSETPTDYSGNGNIALLTKWQSLLAADPINGPAQINNLIWTDMVVNTLVGNDTATILAVAANQPSLSYDFKYSIPAFLSLAIWLPIFFAALFILLTGTLRFSHMRHLLNQTSVGRIIVGDSALTAISGPGALAETGSRGTAHLEMPHWAETVGATLVAFEGPGSRTLKGVSREKTEPSNDNSTEGVGGREDDECASSLLEDGAEAHPRRSLRKVLVEF
ncbi:hypothetical protein PILCRDRAFT_731444 [Piloderma croceum F 1598]|uniref:Uncharacterized protein n=1 Tax=Piloderma croceum (strain F 1598) TaxID=765440 RepID=A0A0C3EZW2_PILCF|nr:hypothetical protein PILCRDRAFT_731444 [Piloderma croceum F 1598]